MRYHLLKPFGFLLAAAFSMVPTQGNALEMLPGLEPSTRLPNLSNIDAFVPPLVEPLHLELDLSSRRVTLLRKGQPFKSYPVAVGRSGWETPTGKFKVKTMYVDPKWVNPFTGEVVPGGASDNPLGRRWMGFWTNGKDWVGFHGTNSVSSIGTAASHGCVRMFEKDIEELYKLVAVGTPVTVKY